MQVDGCQEKQPHKQAVQPHDSLSHPLAEKAGAGGSAGGVGQPRLNAVGPGISTKGTAFQVHGLTLRK